jgi:hypothetical protein
MSGAATWGGGSGLIWVYGNDGQMYFDFVRLTAARDSPPEEAMAATIWSHAVVLGFPWRRFPHGLPPAATRFLKGQEVPAPPDGADLHAWERVFEDALAVALERKDAAAERLRAWRARMRRMRTPAGESPDDSVRLATVLWSLGEEFTDRFAKVDTPKAKALRELADLLLR